MVMAAGGGGGGSNQPPAKKPDPLAVLMAKIGASVGQGGGGGGMAPAALDVGWDGGGSATDYLSQAQSVYEPQFDYLDQLQAAQEKKAAQGDAQLKQLYAQLQAQIAGQAGGIKKDYGQALTDTGNAFNSAYGQTKASYDDSRNGVAATLARLGIQQAGANTVGKQSQQQQLMQNIISANGLASKNNLTEHRASSLAYNTAQKNAAGFQGAEARTGLKGKLMDFLNQLAGKRADLNTQVNSMAMSSQQGAEKSAYDQYKDERDFNYRVAHDKAMLDSKSASTTGSKTKMDPLGQVNQLATQLYGGNQQAAGNAVKAITDAIQADFGGPDAKMTFAQLMDSVYKRLHKANGVVGDQGNLNQIAALLYQQMYGK